MVKAIREINEIATQLFTQDNSHEEFINFGDHFRKLKEFLKQHELDLANEKERELISALQLRLEQVKPEKSEFSGTFRDLREGIHFFLKQKSDAEQGPDWIVKNFEQIDGDILQSKRQFENEEKKTYHFACLSDRDMNQTVNDQLPWPLTDEFLSAAYLPQDLQFQIYCKTLDRRSEFLRYALFYGLCYNRSNVRLSFVKQYGEETTEPYAYLAENGENDRDYVTKVAIPLMSSLFSSPWAFEEVLHRLKIGDSILVDSVAAWKQQAESEHKLVDFALDEDPNVIKGRLMTAMNYIDQETDIVDSSKCKIVVFTAHNATLSAFLELFNAHYSNIGIRAVPFGKYMSCAELEDSVYAFQNDSNCRVIVCDETGGEGRNFQNAEMVIHLDLPWNANTLEQRIGRLDRLGRDSDMDVLSVVLYAEGTIEEQLFHIWRDGMKLFEQSLSGLEIITGELNNLIVDALLNDYYNGLTNAFDDIVDQTDEMRESVEDEQDFDLGTTLYRPLSQGIDNVLNMYAAEDDNPFAAAMMGWGAQAGLHAEKPTSTGLIEFRENTFSVNAAKQSLFIPPNWNRYNDSSIMRREGKILGSFDRKIAATREDILFFAPGDAVYDSIISNAIGCSRGRCSAIGTTGSFNYDGIVFIYNVQPQLDELLEAKIGLQTLSQYRMYLPLKQIMIPISLTAQSRNIPEKDILNTLQSVTERTAEHLGRRSAGRMAMSPLERFMAQTPADQWEPLVDKCSAAAYKKAFIAMREESDVVSAKKEMQRVLNGYRAECIYFDRDNSAVEEKVKVFTATLRALTSTRPVLDAVCFLRVRKNG